MSKVRDETPLTAEEEAAMNAGFASAEVDPADLLSAEDLEDDSPPKKRKERPTKILKQEEEKVPAMSGVGWSDYVFRHFSDDELDPKGNPLVHGLRRVTRLLLGPIVKSKAKVVQAPSLLGGDRATMLQPAVVEYTVELLMCRDTESAYVAEFADAADVYAGNTDEEYARFATAMASTRAEARCLRKALQLRGVSAEETTRVPLNEASVNGFINDTQLNFINVLCSRNDINVLKLCNSGRTKYANVKNIPFGVAARIVEHLSGLQNDPAKVKADILGYDPNWNRNTGDN